MKNIWEEVQRTPQGPVLIYDHSSTTGHTTTVDNFSKVGREVQNLTKTVERINI